MAPPPSREALSLAIGRLLFLKLSKENTQQLFKDAGATPDWSVVAQFTKQVVRTAEAAATLGTHFVNECAVLNAALEPHMFLGGASMCVADLACYMALIAPMEAFSASHKYALCSVSRWFDHMQHAVVDGLKPPADTFGTLRKVEIDCDMPDPPPTIASLPLLVAAPGGATPASNSAAAAAVDVSDAKPPQGKSAAREEKEKAKAAKKEAKAAAPAEAPKDDGGQSDISKLDIRVGLIISADR